MRLVWLLLKHAFEWQTTLFYFVPAKRLCSLENRCIYVFNVSGKQYFPKLSLTEPTSIYFNMLVWRGIGNWMTTHWSTKHKVLLQSTTDNGTKRYHYSCHTRIVAFWTGCCWAVQKFGFLKLHWSVFQIRDGSQKASWPDRWHVSVKLNIRKKISTWCWWPLRWSTWPPAWKN